MKMKKTALGLLISLLIIMMIAGCGSSTNNNGESADSPQETNQPSNQNEEQQDNDKAAKPPKNTEPVTLNVLIEVPGMTDEEFGEFFIDPVQKDNPHISFNLIRRTPEMNLEDLIVAGEIPDMVYGGPNLHGPLEMEYPLDLRDALKQYNVDISKISPNVLESIKAYGNGDEIYSIPFTMNSYALWYNKDIFDKFGADYPSDGMTWDEAIDLGKNLTQVDGGVQYRGIDVINANVYNFASPLSIDLVDPETEEAVISDQWKDVFSLAMKAYNIPGNEREQIRAHNMKVFTKDQTLAMAPFWSNGMVSRLPKAEGLNWDVAQLPYFEDAPNTYIQADYHQIMVSQTTERIDAVMEVLRAAISDEIQTKATRLGKLTVLKDSSITDQFAADLEAFQGKSVSSIFKSEPAQKQFISKYNGPVRSAVIDAFFKVYQGEADINSALREAKEIADQKIAEMKAGE